MEHEFTVIIERDAESGWLVGSVTELPGCYTQAPTLAELDVNIREAVAVHLATAEEDLDMGLTIEDYTRLTEEL